MLRSRKPVPIAFMVLSLLYFFYVIGSGSSRMIGDEIGGDPGTMASLGVISIHVPGLYILVSYRQTASESGRVNSAGMTFNCLSLHSLYQLYTF